MACTRHILDSKLFKYTETNNCIFSIDRWQTVNYELDTRTDMFISEAKIGTYYRKCVIGRLPGVGT